MDAPEKRYHVPAVARVMSLIELLADVRGPMGVSAIAAQLGIPKSSCYTILSTLQECGYAARHHDQRWSLTLKSYAVGNRVAASFDLLAPARPILETLVEETGLTAHLGLYDDTGVSYALKVDSPGMVRFDTFPGKAASLHLTAIARAIAANLPADELAQLLRSHPFEGGTERAPHTEEEFAVILERTRRMGVAFEDEEETEGVCCVAAPVFGGDGHVRAAVGSTALTSQVRAITVESLGEQVRAAAGEVTRALGGTPDETKPMTIPVR